MNGLETADENQGLSTAVINLLKGPVYADRKPEVWEQILAQRGRIQEYLSVMRLTLFLDESEGFAFIRQMPAADENGNVPGLIAQRPMGYGLSVLCLLLRKWLAEHDTNSGDVRAIVTREAIQSELEIYLPEERSEKKRVDRINKFIKQVCELGLLAPLKGSDDRFEILRITKAVINTDWLGDYGEILRQYRERAETGGIDD